MFRSVRSNICLIFRTIFYCFFAILLSTAHSRDFPRTLPIQTVVHCPHPINMLAFATAASGSFLRVSSRAAICPAKNRVFSPAAPFALLRGSRTASSGQPAMSVKNHLKEGDTVPNVIFKTRVRVPEMEARGDPNPFDWKDMTSKDYFKGKRVVVFALPGAFTPTCSTSHLPGYEEDYDKIRSFGVDDVLCISVNDAFVMYQWGRQQGRKNVVLVPDGACLFTRGMGMSANWVKERGFGERSWRYSMVVNDMKIEKLFVEADFIDDSGPDPFEVSDSKTMVKYLESAKK